MSDVVGSNPGDQAKKMVPVFTGVPTSDSFTTKEDDGLHYVWRPCVNMQCYGDPTAEVHYHKCKLPVLPTEESIDKFFQVTSKKLKYPKQAAYNRKHRASDTYDKTIGDLHKKAFKKLFK